LQLGPGGSLDPGDHMAVGIEDIDGGGLGIAVRQVVSAHPGMTPAIENEGP